MTARRKVSRKDCPAIFVEIHGDQYTYERFEWPANLSSRATITCVKHGDFRISPLSLVNGGMCPSCRGEGLRQQVIDRIVSYCGDKYGFELIPDQIPGVVSQIVLVCPEHGEFFMWILNIREGMAGCRGCIAKNRSVHAGEVTMRRFREVHGDLYGYSNFVYSGAHAISLVTCAKHGDSEISAVNHYQGAGCPRCCHGQPSKAEKAWIRAISDRSSVTVENQVRLRSGVGRGRVSADAAFGKVAVNYDGGYWHSRPGSMEKDVHNTQVFQDAGFIMVRLRSNDREGVSVQLVPGAINFTVSPDPSTPESLAVLDAIIEIIRKENHHD